MTQQGFGYATALCTSCGQEIVWSTSPKGARMPIDARPASDLEAAGVKVPATLYRLEGTGRTPNAVKDEDASNPLSSRGYDRSRVFASHFATCPNAGQHSKGGKR